ncbi:MAG: hypothetical protein OXQ89_07250 [Rhodospirillaceae bacterium]|nr:hypothetical protein [Rhodospirillaceae bacterium]
MTVDIEQARETLYWLVETSRGVELREIDGERLVVLPSSALELMRQQDRHRGSVRDLGPSR